MRSQGLLRPRLYNLQMVTSAAFCRSEQLTRLPSLEEQKCHHMKGWEHMGGFVAVLANNLPKSYQ